MKLEEILFFHFHIHTKKCIFQAPLKDEENGT